VFSFYSFQPHMRAADETQKEKEKVVFHAFFE
jgi:hypothetical protein